MTRQRRLLLASLLALWAVMIPACGGSVKKPDAPRQEVATEGPAVAKVTSAEVEHKSQSNPPPASPKQDLIQPQKAPELPYDLKGDRLGMSLQDFKEKYRRSFDAGKKYEAPFSSDQRDETERERKPIPTLGEEPWHVKAKIVNARITFPFEDDRKGREVSQYTPTLAGVRASHHLYRFIDGQLYRIELFFPQAGFTKVCTLHDFLTIRPPC